MKFWYWYLNVGLKSARKIYQKSKKPFIEISKKNERLDLWLKDIHLSLVQRQLVLKNLDLTLKIEFVEQFAGSYVRVLSV